MLSCHTNLVSCLFFFVVEVSSLQSSSQETIDEREVFDLQLEVRLSCSYVLCIETGVTGCREGELNHVNCCDHPFQHSSCSVA